MQEETDPELTNTVDPADTKGDAHMTVEGEDAVAPKSQSTNGDSAVQVPSLSDIFFNGGRGSLDLKMSKSEHNPRKFSRRIVQTPDKKTPHRTSSSSVHKVTTSKSGGIPVTSDHGTANLTVRSSSYRRSNSFSRRRSHHPDKRKISGTSTKEIDSLRASEGALAPDSSEELMLEATLTMSATTGTATSTVTSASTRRRTGLSGSGSGHRRARTSRIDSESRQATVAQLPVHGTGVQDPAGSSPEGRAEPDSADFAVQIQPTTITATDSPTGTSGPEDFITLSNGTSNSNTSSNEGENGLHAPTTTTTERDHGNQQGKPRSLSFEQKAGLPNTKAMARGDSNSSTDNPVARPHRSSHSSERRRHRRTIEPRTNTNGTATSPARPTNDQDLTKRTRSTHRGTTHGSWTRNLRRMRKPSEGESHPTNSTSTHNTLETEDSSTHSTKLEKSSVLDHEEETNTQLNAFPAGTSNGTSQFQPVMSHSQRQRRREAGDHRDSKASSEGDKKSHHSPQEQQNPVPQEQQNPVSSSRRSPVPSSPDKDSQLTPRRHKSKTVNRSSDGNVLPDDTRSPPLSQFLDSLLVGDKANVIAEESVLSNETTATEGLTTAPQLDFFATEDFAKKIGSTLSNSLEVQHDHNTTNSSHTADNGNTDRLVDGHDQPNHDDSNMDNHPVVSNGETQRSGSEKLNIETDHPVLGNDQGFNQTKSASNDFLMRSPTQMACITEHHSRVASPANPANKSMPFPARIPMLPKGALFSPSGRSSMFFDKEAMDQGMKKLANLNLSVTSHGRKKKGLNKFLATTTSKFNKLADGGDSVCLDDLPLTRESTETTRQETAKSSHVPLDKMFMKSSTNKDDDDNLNDSGGLSFSMDLAVSGPKSYNNIFSLSAQPSRRGLFAKKPKKFQTFDDSGVISFSMDDTNLPKQTGHEGKKGTSQHPPQKETIRNDDDLLERSVFGAGFDLDAHMTSTIGNSRMDCPSEDNTATLDNPGGASSDDFAWKLPGVADMGKFVSLPNRATRSKSVDLADPSSICPSSKEYGDDRGSKLHELLEQPGNRKLSQLAEPSICGTLPVGGKSHVKEASSFTAKGSLDHEDQGKGGFMCEEDEDLSHGSFSSDRDVANPLPDGHRGIQLKDVLDGATKNPAPSDASVCEQSVMTLEQQQEHFLQLNLPGMVGYKSSSSLSVLEHAVEVLGESTGRRGAY